MIVVVTALVALSGVVSIAAAAPAKSHKRGGFPFTSMVAFGDNLSDNGAGSYVHGVAQAGDPTNNIYGFGTWTNGPVAVSYLSHDLNMSLNDYAFGHADGGSKFGATVDNSYTQSTANAPSTKDQINSYVKSEHVADAGKALHFLWTGNNDINLYHIGTAVGSDNSKFAKEMSTRISAQVKTLVDAGAAYVFVPSLYAKHISPSRQFYAGNEQQYQIMGEAIQGANQAIASSLKQFGDKVIYYDVFSKMVQLWNDHESLSITHTDAFCDGYSQQDWDKCVVQHQGDSYYWMQYLDMTSHVHWLIAKDMYATLKSRFNVA